MHTYLFMLSDRHKSRIGETKWKILTRLFGFEKVGYFHCFRWLFVLSSPSCKDISSLSHFFAPPGNMKMTMSSNVLRTRILEQEGRCYGQNDVDLVTSQTLKWSFNIIGMRNQIRNFGALCSLWFGCEDLLSTNSRS